MLIKTYRLRLYVLYLIPVLLMGGLVARLYYVQILNKPFYEEHARIQHYKKYSIIPMRGKIFDSEGHELAGSVVLDQAYLNLRAFDSATVKKRLDEEKLPTILSEFAAKLALILNDPSIHEADILRRLRGEINRHPLLAKGITEEKKVALREALREVAKVGIPANLIEFVPETRRRYSRGSLAPHVVGYMAWDNRSTATVGVDGVERIYEDILRGKQEQYTARQTARGKAMEPADPSLLESTFGNSIKLTINETLQAVTQNVLQQGVEKTGGDAGIAVCYAVKTGEILALANYPSFDVNNLRASAEAKQNRAVSYAIEPGSVMKIITFASLFDDKKVEPFDTINLEGGVWYAMGTRRIEDSKKMGMASVAEVFQYSSNIGTIKAARAYDHPTFHDRLKRFGFGQRTGIDLPNESPGYLKPHKEWSGYSMSSLPMGYELQITAIQAVAAVGAIANKGNYMQPHVVKEILDHNGDTIEKIEPKFLRSVADPEACRKVVDLMELVVEKGTAKPAKLEGYRVGGKTGTTKKLVNGKYEKAYIASFCGIAPIEDPEVCIYVYVDNPKGDKVYGGSVAAPIFREIAREAMKILRVPQQRPRMPADEFKKTLEMVRNKIEGRVPVEMVHQVGEAERGEVAPGIVPNLRNLTLREAIEQAAIADLMVIPKGSGTIVSQTPGAYETIEGERVVHVELESSDEVLTRQLSEVREYFGEQPDLDDFRSSITLAALPATSVPLSLRFGGQQIKLPLSMTSGESTEGPAQGNQRSATEIQASYPDLDQFANANLEKNTGKNFDEFMKKYAELEEQKLQQSREPREVGTEVTRSTSSDAIPAGPVPEIDGTEDFDPAIEAPTPIEIDTPRIPRRTMQEPVLPGDQGVSLYNF